MIDKDLILRFCNGDEAAFRLIFDEHVQKVFGYVNSYLRSRADAEDLTQSIFLKIWERRAQVDPGKPFDPYLFTVAYRSIIDYFRNRARTPRMIEVDPESNFYTASDFDTESRVRQHEIESFYSRALAELPEKRRRIFELSRHQGLSNKEIAEELGISVKTVENQMTAALASLRAFFLDSEFPVLWLPIIFFNQA